MGASWSRPLLIEPVDGGFTFGYPTVGPCGRGRVCVSYTLDSGTGANHSRGIRFAAFDARMLLPMT